MAQTTRQHRISPHVSLDIIVQRFAWCLCGLVVGYTLLIPYAWTQSREWQDAFWQVHTLVFVGNVLLLLATLARVPKHQHPAYRWACVVLLFSHVLTVSSNVVSLTTDVDMSAFQSGSTQTIATWNMFLYTVIYVGHNFGLLGLIPLWSFPIVRVLRLLSDHLLVVAIVNVVLHLLLPRLFTDWIWTPTITANELRLVVDIGLLCWYVMVYRRFGTFGGRSVIVWGVGLVCMVVTDITFLWASYKMAHGASYFLLCLGMPFWDVQQVFWSLGLYWHATTPLKWSTTSTATNPPQRKLTWVLTLRYSVLLTVLAIISSGIAPSVGSTIWLVTALLSREVIGAYELLIANRQLAAYAAQAEELATIRERNRLAGDIHDGLGHYFTSIGAQIAAARILLDANRPRAIRSLENVQQLADEGLTEVRRSVTTLRQPHDGPFLSSIERLVDVSNTTGVSTQMHVEGVVRPLTHQVDDTLYRVVQEALNNVRKHANATYVQVHIDYRAPDSIRLIVMDDGQGMHSLQNGNGLHIMRERVTLVGGSLSISTALGQGLQIDVELPG